VGTFSYATVGFAEGKPYIFSFPPELDFKTGDAILRPHKAKNNN